MRADRCLGCYRPIDDDDGHFFHPACSRRVFGTSVPPDLPYSEADLLRLAEDAVARSITVTGVQTKMSIGVERVDGGEHQRFTIVGVWGSHILKPPTPHYPHLPELEDLTMHLAAIAGLRTVPHALLKLRDGRFAYITRRVDRRGRPGSPRTRKIPMEDMAQVTERITEHKYRGSYEQVAKALREHTSEPNVSVLEFYEQVLFGFLTGNSDMHLKNFSIISDDEGRYNLAPAYDHIATTLVIQDNEELALTLNSRRNKITRDDFETAMRAGGLNERSILNLFNRMKKAFSKWHDLIAVSFVPEELKERYKALVDARAERMNW